MSEFQVMTNVSIALIGSVTIINISLLLIISSCVKCLNIVKDKFQMNQSVLFSNHQIMDHIRCRIFYIPSKNCWNLAELFKSQQINWDTTFGCFVFKKNTFFYLVWCCDGKSWNISNVASNEQCVDYNQAIRK